MTKSKVHIVKTPLIGQEHKTLAAEWWEVVKSHSVYSTSHTSVTISITVPHSFFTTTLFLQGSNSMYTLTPLYIVEMGLNCACVLDGFHRD